MLNTTANETRPQFLEGSRGRLFCVEFPAPSARNTGAAVLVVPPIGEEMNKCRRMLTLAARACQAAGLTALITDLYGTGDSAGDFRDGTVVQWRDDLHASMSHLLSGGAKTLPAAWSGKRMRSIHQTGYAGFHDWGYEYVRCNGSAGRSEKAIFG